MPKPLISIVMPAFNADSTITQSVGTVLEQTYENWELIVVDDASYDDTAAQVEKIDDNRIKLLRNEANSGPAHSRNVGMAAAGGAYIAFLDADDYWESEKLNKQLEFMQKTACAISFTGYWRVGYADQRKLGQKSAKSLVTYKDMLSRNHIGCLTAMFEREKFTGLTFENPSNMLATSKVSSVLKRGLNGRVAHEDYVFWLSAMRPDATLGEQTACGLNEPLAYYRTGGSSFSGNKFHAALSQWFIYRHIEKLGLWRSAWYFHRYAINGLWTRLLGDRKIY